jgi:hypothetical protein
MKRCKHIEADGFHHCSSYAFNLYKDDIEQGDLCDVHYWQDQAQKARADEREKVAALCDQLSDSSRDLRFGTAIRART